MLLGGLLFSSDVYHPFNILRDHVSFEVYFIAGCKGREVGKLPGLRNDGDVEGIMYLTKSDEEFVQTYIVNKKPWF